LHFASIGFNSSRPFYGAKLRRTLSLSGGPQETNAEADKKPPLWAVSSEPLLGDVHDSHDRRLFFLMLLDSGEYLFYGLTFVKPSGNFDIIGRLTVEERKKSESRRRTELLIQDFDPSYSEFCVMHDLCLLWLSSPV
jgi:hypothetical protein